MDWGTIIPTAVTGVVGLAGIGGSIASASLASKSASEDLKRNISAENARLKRADKRLIYASFLAAVTKLDDLSLNRKEDHRDLQEFLDTERAAWLAVQEIILIGPPRASHAASEAYNYARDNNWEGYRVSLAQAVAYMRTDLDDKQT